MRCTWCKWCEVYKVYEVYMVCMAYVVYDVYTVYEKDWCMGEYVVNTMYEVYMMFDGVHRI